MINVFSSYISFYSESCVSANVTKIFDSWIFYFHQSFKDHHWELVCVLHLSRCEKYRCSSALWFWSGVTESYSCSAWKMWCVLNDCYFRCFIFGRCFANVKCGREMFDSRCFCVVKHRQIVLLHQFLMIRKWVQISGKQCLP